MPESSERTEPHRHRVVGAPARPRTLAALDRLSPYWGPQLVALVAILLDLILPNLLGTGSLTEAARPGARGMWKPCPTSCSPR